MKIKSNSNWLTIVIGLSLLLSSACVSSTGSATDQASETQKRKLRKSEQDVLNHSAQINAGGEQVTSFPSIKLYPVDEASQDRSFELFRKALLKAAREHNVDYVLNILDPHILNSLGGIGGVDEFKEQWRLDQPDTELWKELITILSMGGSFDTYEGQKEFCASYVSSQWEKVVSQFPKTSDVSQYSAIISENVLVHQEPASNSPIVATLSYDVVKVDYEGSILDKTESGNFSWVKIITPDEKQGYVSGQYIRDPSDYHACFKKIGERWIMTALAGGD